MAQTTPTTAETDANAADCIRLLGSRKAAERDAAERKLRRMGAAAVEPLLALMKREDHRLAKRHRIGRGIEWYFRMALWSGVPLCFLLLVLHVSCPDWMGRFFFGSFALSMFYNIFVEFWLTTGTRKHRQAIRIVTDSEDLRVVGPLCAFLPHRLSPERALIKLLPRLRASDAHLLNAHERACLYERLRTNTRGSFQGGYAEELTLAILKALEQIGDGQAALYVYQAAKTAKSPKVREAASNCLPYLMQRAEQERATNSLLRPSHAADVSDKTLLRAAQNTPGAEPQQLLRASIAEGYIPPDVSD